MRTQPNTQLLIQLQVASSGHSSHRGCTTVRPEQRNMTPLIMAWLASHACSSSSPALQRAALAWQTRTYSGNPLINTGQHCLQHAGAVASAGLRKKCNACLLQARELVVVAQKKVIQLFILSSHDASSSTAQVLLPALPNAAHIARAQQLGRRHASPNEPCQQWQLPVMTGCAGSAGAVIHGTAKKLAVGLATNVPTESTA